MRTNSTPNPNNLKPSGQVNHAAGLLPSCAVAHVALALALAAAAVALPRERHHGCMPGARRSGGLFECSWTMNSHPACIAWVAWQSEGEKRWGMAGSIHPPVRPSIPRLAGWRAGWLGLIIILAMDLSLKLHSSIAAASFANGNGLWFQSELGTAGPLSLGPSWGKCPWPGQMLRGQRRMETCVWCANDHTRDWRAGRTPAAGSAIRVTPSPSSLGLWANGPLASGPSMRCNAAVLRA